MTLSYPSMVAFRVTGPVTSPMSLWLEYAVIALMVTVSPFYKFRKLAQDGRRKAIFNRNTQ